MFEVSLDLLTMLLCAAFIAGFIDAIAGGGGLITLPMLLLAGASPIQALSTNKVQGSLLRQPFSMQKQGRSIYKNHAFLPS
jgi:uncharacterized protein